MQAHPDRIAKPTSPSTSELLDAMRAGDAEAAAQVVRRHVSRVAGLVRGEVR